MKAPLKKYLFLLLPMLMISLNLNGQTTHKLSGAEFTISGTSSLHDWTMTSQSATGEAIVSFKEKSLEDIKKVSVILKGETLKSGKSGMDDNAYKALKTKKNPDISFSLTNVKSIVKNAEHYLVVAEGTLTIAGETKTVNVQIKALSSANSLVFTGSDTFKMTEYKIDPPTALLGTIKTGDEITINYQLTFKSN